MFTKTIVYDQKLFAKDLDHLKKRYNSILIKSTGFDNVDLEHAKKIGLEVKWLPDYSSASVAQWCSFALLWLTMRINLVSDRLKTRVSWKQGEELENQYAIVIGSEGHVGKKIFKTLEGLGLIVHRFDPGYFFHDSDEKLLSLLQDVKVIVFACPLNSQTRDYFKPRHFAAMKNQPFIINPIRSALVNLDLVQGAIHKGTISGFALDEKPNHILEGSNQCFFTPHIAARTVQAQQRKRDLISKIVLSLKPKT